MDDLVTEASRLTLVERAAAADGELAWPEGSWQELRRVGALGWSIPEAYGGKGLDTVSLLTGYEQLASACLTTCFLLSQRDAAVRRIQDSENELLRHQLLPALARGDSFATVGLSQLTTSRQHVKPSLTAEVLSSRIRFHGTIPWVTGADQADHLVIGAVTTDGRQVLGVLPRRAVGVQAGPPLDLMALRGSLTAEVHCYSSEVDGDWILAGPAERVLSTARGGAGGLETSCLALGLAQAAIGFLLEESKTRREVGPVAERLEQTRQALRQELHQLAEGERAPDQAIALRARANAHVLQATQAALTASKGTGFLRNHPAQRWARQALFFLVWSCPRAAADATLAFLARGLEPGCL